jgi:hypothetical protein
VGEEEMSKTVIVLGAGASRQAGGPLMADFLDHAQEVWLSGQAGTAYEPSFALVFRAIAALQVAHSKANIDLLNIESVFAAFEMAKLFEALDRLEPTDVQELPRAMRRVIVRTLEQRIAIRVVGLGKEGTRVVPPECYDRFALLVARMGASVAGPTSVATFNYDMAVDYGFYWTQTPVNYCLSRAAGTGIPLLKLHGSMNWARCTTCREVVPWYLPAYLSSHRWGPLVLTPGSSLLMLIAEHLAALTHCEAPVEPEPVIVPPTWSKTQHHAEIASVWRHAAAHLAEAENILVFGYSLPLTDQFFRYLYALGTIGATRLKRFWVYNPDHSGEVERRFRDLLGQAATSRFRMMKNEFCEAIGLVAKEFGVSLAE